MNALLLSVALLGAAWLWTPDTDWLRRITAPTLLLWGAKDAMIPAANAGDYQAAIAGAEVVTLPGLGHLPHEEGPAVSLAPVRAFLAR